RLRVRIEKPMACEEADGLDDEPRRCLRISSIERAVLDPDGHVPRHPLEQIAAHLLEEETEQFGYIASRALENRRALARTFRLIEQLLHHGAELGLRIGGPPAPQCGVKRGQRERLGHALAQPTHNAVHRRRFEWQLAIAKIEVGTSPLIHEQEE